jgi:hypothetical protein
VVKRTVGRIREIHTWGNQVHSQGSSMKTLATHPELVRAWLLALAGMPLPPLQPARPAIPVPPVQPGRR